MVGVDSINVELNVVVGNVEVVELVVICSTSLEAVEIVEEIIVGKLVVVVGTVVEGVKVEILERVRVVGIIVFVVAIDVCAFPEFD